MESGRICPEASQEKENVDNFVSSYSYHHCSKRNMNPFLQGKVPRLPKWNALLSDSMQQHLASFYYVGNVTQPSIRIFWGKRAVFYLNLCRQWCLPNQIARQTFYKVARHSGQPRTDRESSVSGFTLNLTDICDTLVFINLFFLYTKFSIF